MSKKAKKAAKRAREAQAQAPAAATGKGLFSTHNDDMSTKNSRRNRIARGMALQQRLAFEPPKATALPVGAGMDDYEGGEGLYSAKPQLTNMNFGIPEIQLLWYSSQGFIGYQMCAILAQHWLIDKACSMPARDAVRNGYDLTVNDGTTLPKGAMDYVKEQDKHFQLDDNLISFVRMGRVFGIRHCLFVFDSGNSEYDKEFYAHPFNPDGIKAGSYKGMSQIDPYWITPQLSTKNVRQPGSRHFYDPDFWLLAGFGPIHRSHLIIFSTGEVADILKQIYNYGGVSIPQRIYERVYAAERTANEAPMLAMTKRLTVMATDLDEAIANPTKFETRMEWWQQTRDNYGVKFNGLEDKIEQFDISLADLDSVIMTQYQLCAAIAGVPGTKLLGTQPKGFNSTGEFEETSYHEELETIQSNDMERVIDRHHICLMHSHVKIKFKVVFRIDVDWSPLDAMSALEEAQVRIATSENDALQVGIGAIDAQEVRDRIIADKNSGYNGLTSLLPPMPDNPDPDAPPAIPGKPGAAPAAPRVGNPQVAALAPKPVTPRAKVPPGA